MQLNISGFGFRLSGFGFPQECTHENAKGTYPHVDFNIRTSHGRNWSDSAMNESRHEVDQFGRGGYLGSEHDSHLPQRDPPMLQGAGCRVQVAGFKVWGVGCRVQGVV